MKILFSHVARCNLKQMDKPTLLFETFRGNTFFHHAILEISRCQKVDRVVLICPQGEEDFFRARVSESLRAFPEANQGKAPKIDFFSVPLQDPAAFVPENSRFEPVSMETLDYFGMWNSVSLESIAEKFQASEMLVTNLESAWFLSASSIDELLDEAVLGDSVFSLNYFGQEDLIVSLGLERAKFARTKHESMRKQGIGRIKENLKEMKCIPSPSRQIDNLQEQGIDQNFPLPLRISQLIIPASERERQRAEMVQRISENPLSLSLRWRDGISILNRMNEVIGGKESLPLQKGEAFLPRCPEVVWMNTGFPDALDKGLYERTLDVWAKVPYWILKEEPFPADPERVRGIIEALYPRIIGKIYFETSGLSLDRAKLESLFSAGLRVLVFDYDAYLEKSDDSKGEKIAEKILSLLEVTRSLPGHFMLIKVQNRSQDNAFIPSLVRQWKYVTDGLVIMPDEDQGAFRAKPENIRCSKAGTEIHLDYQGRLLICPCLKEKPLKSDDIHSWGKLLLQAGNFKECLGCKEKYFYGPCHRPFWNENGALSYVLKERRGSMLAQARESLTQGNLDEGLSLLEAILCLDPSEEEAWELLDKMERISDAFKK